MERLVVDLDVVVVEEIMPVAVAAAAELGLEHYDFLHHLFFE